MQFRGVDLRSIGPPVKSYGQIKFGRDILITNASKMAQIPQTQVFSLIQGVAHNRKNCLSQNEFLFISRNYFVSEEKAGKKPFQMSSPPKALRATKVMVTKPVKKRSKSSSGLVRARSRYELISSG